MTVSVLIPAYNAAKTLGETLSALAHQTRAADEVLVCDDGSTDDTAAVAARFPFVRLFGEINGGVSVARNALLARATGEAVLFCDADDRPHPEWLSTLVGTLEATGADLAVAGLRTGLDLSERRYVYPSATEGVIPGAEFYREQIRRRRGGYAYLPCVAFRRRLAAGLAFVPGLAVQEDECFLLRLAKRARRVAVSTACPYDYVYRADSACATHFRGPVGKAQRRAYARRDWDKFKATGQARFLAAALKNALQGL